MLWTARTMHLIALLAFLTSCGSDNQNSLSLSLNKPATSSSSSDSLNILTDPRFDSQYLLSAGRRSVAFFFELIEKRNAYLTERNAPYRLQVVDARDPRLYQYRYPLQPPSPATRAIIRDSANHFEVVALIWEGPFGLTIKAPNGGFAYAINYTVHRIEFKDTFNGLIGSVNRNTSGYGWNYVFYLRGMGNQVNPSVFDRAISDSIKGLVRQL